jgi:hypothetical protein
VPPADTIVGSQEGNQVAQVIIGVDPHKHSATIEIINQRERVSSSLDSYPS